MSGNASLMDNMQIISFELCHCLVSMKEQWKGHNILFHYCLSFLIFADGKAMLMPYQQFFINTRTGQQNQV